MNQRDQQNLDFLLGLSPEGLEKWFEQSSIEDREYASELLDTYENILSAELAEEFFGYDLPTSIMQ